MRVLMMPFVALCMLAVVASGVWGAGIPLTNGSFENTVPSTDNLDYWVAADTGATITCPNDGSHAVDGQRYLQIDATGGYGYVWGPFGEYAPSVQVEAGKTYTLSIWVSKVPGKVCPGIKTRLYVVPTKGVFDVGATGTFVELSTTAQTVDWQWAKYSVTFDSNLYPGMVGLYLLPSFRVDGGAANLDMATLESSIAVTNGSFENIYPGTTDGLDYWVAAQTGATIKCVQDSHAVDGSRVLQIDAPVYGYVWGPYGDYAPNVQVQMNTKYTMSVWVSKVPGKECPGAKLRLYVGPTRGVFDTGSHGTYVELITDPLTQDWQWTKYTVEYEPNYGLPPAIGYYFFFFMRVGFGAANFDMVTFDSLPAEPVTIDGAKKATNGTYVVVNSAIVTAKLYNDTDGFIGYAVEDPGRSSGIRVISYVDRVQVGDDVATVGTVDTIDGERIINAGARITEVNSSGNPVPGALGMANNKSGGGTNGGQGSVVDDATSSKMSAGLNSVGLLVKVFGKVTAVNDTGAYDGYFYIDDGSGINDGSGDIGIRCRPAGTGFTPDALPGKDTYATVTGIMGVQQVGGVNARYLWSTAVNP